jgi:EAL domain-containing protein (putative c-di-GMP-specific phosphodiesterase class I)
VYSNFSNLHDQEPDYIKIDGSLIKNIDTDEKSYNIVKTIVIFAHNLNIKVIAEFVHSKEVLEVCQQLNIDEFQGYFFGEPLSHLID